jgi:hypothetical protein
MLPRRTLLYTTHVHLVTFLSVGHVTCWWLGDSMADQWGVGKNQFLEVCNIILTISSYLRKCISIYVDVYDMLTSNLFWVLSWMTYNNAVQFSSFDPDPTVRHSFWSLIIGSMINWTGPYGASQQSTQRFGSLPTLRKAKMYESGKKENVVIKHNLQSYLSLHTS